MPETLDDLLRGLPDDARGEPGVFVPQHGDCVFVYLDDAPYRRVYVDPILTVFEALDDDRLVGFQLKGLQALVAKSLQGVNIETNPPIIELLFESFRIGADGVEPALRTRTYARVAAAAARLEAQLA